MNDLKPVVEIFIMALGIYGIFVFLRGTRGLGILKGLGTISVLLLVVIAVVASWLPTVNFIYERILSVVVLALVIVFQPELRRGLIRLGQNPLVEMFIKSDSQIIEQVTRAVTRLAKQKIGALIAIEREIGIRSIIERGVSLDAEVNSALIETIFWPGSALHDGAITIKDNRIAAAGCLFPLTDNPKISKRLGTRHRAALGIAEESDAIAIVVSEETGAISVCFQGKLHQDIGPEGLTAFLQKQLSKPETNGSRNR